MRTHFRRIPNQITLLRLLSLPVLWIYALAGDTTALGVGLILCGLSDKVDGILARRLRLTSAFGAMLDSVTDQLLIGSAFVWVFLLMPELLLNHPLAIASVLFLLAVMVCVSWIKFHQPPNLHLYLTQWSGLLRYILITHAFLFGTYSEVLFHLTWGIYMLSLSETLLVLLIVPRVNADMKSLPHLLWKMRTETGTPATRKEAPL